MQGIPSVLGADRVVGFSQDEGLSALGRGQYGWPIRKEPSILGADRVVGFSQDEGLSALGQGHYGCPECKGFQAFWGRTGWSDFRRMRV